MIQFGILCILVAGIAADAGKNRINNYLKQICLI